MTPVKQTILTPPCGNCHAACIASILELPLVRVPSLYDGADRLLYDKEAAWGRQHSWLKAMGLTLLHYDRADHPDMKGDDGSWPGWTPHGLWIATHEQRVGGTGHSTVWKAGKLVWDPMPGATQSADGLGTLMMMEWFECLDPALLARNLPGRWKRSGR